MTWEFVTWGALRDFHPWWRFTEDGYLYTWVSGDTWLDLRPFTALTFPA